MTEGGFVAASPVAGGSVAGGLVKGGSVTGGVVDSAGFFVASCVLSVAAVAGSVVLMVGPVLSVIEFSFLLSL